MIIRRMQARDLPAGLDLCRISNWNQIEPDWRGFLDSPQGAGWVAERDGVVLGTVTILGYGSAFTWVSMMLVHPDVRRSGIGSRLMEAALGSAASCFRLDATPLGEPLYRRFGFEGEYQLVRATICVPDLSEMPKGVRPMLSGDFPEVFAMDREIFGADRSRLLESVHRRGPQLAWFAPGRGYCFGRPGHRYRQIGPVAAQDAATAHSLVLACLQSGGTIAIDIPLDLAPWVQDLGFSIERPFLRMYRGSRPPAHTSWLFATTGPEFG